MLQGLTGSVSNLDTVGWFKGGLLYRKEEEAIMCSETKSGVTRSQLYRCCPVRFCLLKGHTWRSTSAHSHAAERMCCYCSLQWSFSSFDRISEILVFLQEHWSRGPCQTGVCTTAKGCASFAGAREALLVTTLALHLPELDLIALSDFEACCCTWPSNPLYLGWLPSLSTSFYSQ